MGRVLQFSYYEENTKKSQQYHGSSVDLFTKDVGVLCTWFAKITLQQFSVISRADTHHSYITLQLYICTLTHARFQRIQSTAKGSNNMMNIDFTRVDLATTEVLTLTTDALCFIESEFESRTHSSTPTCTSESSSYELNSTSNVVRESNSTHSECEIIVVSGDTSPAPAVPMETQWVKHGDVALTRRHLQDIVNGKELSDLHIDAFQNIVKIQFSHK